MKKFKTVYLRKGFTLAELLIVVAIIAVLVCIGIVMINPQDLSYVEYNRCAESIATAVQNRLTALRNAGQLADLRTLGIVDDPPKEGEGSAVKTGASDEYRYIFNFENGGKPNSNSSIRYFVPFGSIELQLEEGYFAIGFQPQSGTVGEVFYSEEAFDHSVASLKKMSDREEDGTITKGKNSGERKKNDIGYYVGEVDAQEVALAQLPTPQLTITNYEELTLSIYLPKVRELGDKKLAISVCLADAKGEAYGELTYKDTKIYDSTVGHISQGGLVKDGLSMGQPYTIILDTPDPEFQFDIEKGKQGKIDYPAEANSSSFSLAEACFETWAHQTKAYRCSSEGEDYFRPGDNVQITVFVYGLDANGKIDNTYMERSASVVFNSWFDTFDGEDTVTIATGRHLQNLGNLTKMNDKMKENLPTIENSTYKEYSRGKAYQYTEEAGTDNVNKKWDYRKSSNDYIVRDAITTAKQVKSIDFNNSVWQKNGKEVPFTPVNLPSGFTYYGNYQTIRHLWVDAPFYAGLFGYAYNVSLYDIMLVNPHVVSHMPAYISEIYEMGVGALIGTSRNSNYIYNCQAFMEAEDGTYDEENYRVVGNGYVGGLIGFCEDENIRQNSASVFTGNADGSSLYVGGLIGCITGDSNVKRCYGAGNLSGQYVGGLIGVVMEDSNSAGDNYVIQSCYTAGHIEKATKSAAGLIGRIWEQGGYYKSALGANSNYCVVIYGTGSGDNYTWDSKICDYKVQSDGTFSLSKETTTPTPIYGTFEGDGFEWLNSNEVGYFTGEANGETMFLGADFDSDNKNYFIPQRGITYSDSPYFTEVKKVLENLISTLEGNGTNTTNLQNTVNTYRLRLRYAKLLDALEELKGEFENLLYELECESAGGLKELKDDVKTKAETLYGKAEDALITDFDEKNTDHKTFMAYYNTLKPALERLRDDKYGNGGSNTKANDQKIVEYCLGNEDNDKCMYDVIFRDLRNNVIGYSNDTASWFAEYVDNRMCYYLNTMDEEPQKSTLSDELKATLQEKKLLGIQSAIDALTTINNASSKWTDSSAMKNYKDLIKELSAAAKTELDKLYDLTEGEGIEIEERDVVTRMRMEIL